MAGGVKPKAALWARISTRKESQERSLEVQMDRLREAAAARGYKVSMEYGWRGLSGWDTAKGLDEAIDTLLEDAEAVGFEAVFVTRLDRFSRAGILHTLGAFQRLKERGIRFIAIDEIGEVDTGSPQGEMIISNLATMARWFSESHSARVKEGMARAKERGVKMGRPRKSRRSRVVK